MIKVYGASDDLIEVEGDIREEFTALFDCHDNVGGILAFSEGTIVRIVYDIDGIWRITPIRYGDFTIDIKIRS